MSRFVFRSVVSLFSVMLCMVGSGWWLTKDVRVFLEIGLVGGLLLRGLGWSRITMCRFCFFVISSMCCMVDV